MYEHQGLQDVLFVMLYGGATMTALLAALYLLLRRANALVPDVDSPRELRGWAALFLLSVAASHVWWYILGVHCLTDDRLLRNIIAITLDRITFVPLMMCFLLRMLQHKRFPLWPVALSMMPFVVIAVASIVKRDDAFEWYTEIYSFLLCVCFFAHYIYALRQYGSWLRDNYADLEHKEVWQSMILITCILLVYVVYTTNEGALATEYLAQMLTLVIIGFVVWRVESLSKLPSTSASPIQEILNQPSVDEADRLMDSLLQEYCEQPKLFLLHNLSLAQLAVAVGTNRTYLSSYFTNKGETYNAYINRLRIAHFCHLYHQAVASKQSFTAHELAWQSGYRSYSTFSLAFKQMMGQRASEWMRNQETES